MSPLLLVVRLDSMLTENKFKLFSGQSCHTVDSKIMIT